MKEQTEEQIPHSSLQQFASVILLSFIAFELLAFLSYTPFDVDFYTTSPNDPALNYCGRMGSYFSFIMFFSFGVASLITPVFIASLAVRLLWGISARDFLLWCFYTQLALLSTSVIFSLYCDPLLLPWIKSHQIFSSGGLIGRMFGQEMALVLLGKIWPLIGGVVLFSISLQGIAPFSYTRAAMAIWKGLKWSSGIFKNLTLVLVARISEWVQILWQKLARDSTEDLLQDDYIRDEKKTLSYPASPVSFEQEKKQEKNGDERGQDSPSLPAKTISDPPPPPKKIERKPENKALMETSHLRKKTGVWEFPSVNFLNEPQSSSLDLEENVQANGV